MSNSFASLLRASRIATYDRNIQQVYKTTKNAKNIGDWGLKRNLPTVIRTPNLTVGSLDTAEHQTPWRSGNSETLFIKRWKENFPFSTKVAPRAETEQYNIVKMTPAEFKRFLQRCAKKAPEFKKLLERAEKVPEQVFEYLQIKFSDGPGDHIVGPTYSSHMTDQTHIVQGRILNSSKRKGNVVGIAGITAFLPKHNSVGVSQLGNRRVRPFYVVHASINQDGSPNVVVSASPPKDKHEDPNYVPLTPEFFLSRNLPLEEKDNSKPSPDHDKLMLRIMNLLHK